MILAVAVTLNASDELRAATWLTQPASGEWATATNWSSGNVPDTAGEVAEFGESSIHAISLSSFAGISRLTFNDSATPYEITVSGGGVLQLLEAGILSKATSGITVTGQASALSFFGNAGASHTRLAAGQNGQIVFLESAHAEDAQIAVGATGFVGFHNQSSAGNAHLQVDGLAQFIGEASGGAMTAAVTGEMTFFNDSSAAKATLVIASGGRLGFVDRSSASEAAIVNSGVIFFMGAASGGTAELTGTPGSRLDIRSLETAGITLGALNGSGEVDLGDKTLSVGAGGADSVFSGRITGVGGSLVKLGAGTVALLGANDFSGSATLESGVLAIGAAQASGLGPLVLRGGELRGINSVEVANPALVLGADATTVISSVSGQLTLLPLTLTREAGNHLIFKSGSGSIELRAASAISLGVAGPITVLSGSVSAGSDALGELTAAASVTTVNREAAIDFQHGLASIKNLEGGGRVHSFKDLTVEEGTFSGELFTSNIFVKEGEGTFTLNGRAKLVAANAEVRGGTLNLETSVADGVPQITVRSGAAIRVGSEGISPVKLSIEAGGDGLFENGGSLGFHSIDNAGSLVFRDGGNGDGTILTRSGATTRFEGTAYPRTSNLRSEPGGLVAIDGLESATFTVNAIDAAGRFFLGDRTLAVAAGTISGALSGKGGALTKIGVGMVTLSGKNSFDGGTTIEAGILAIHSDANLGAAGEPLWMSGGVLKTLESVDLARPVVITGASTLDTGSRTLRITGRLSGISPAVIPPGGIILPATKANVLLRKIGSGLLTLSADNPFAGTLQVEEGGVELAGSIAGNLTLLAGRLTGHGIVGGNLRNNGMISPGNSPGTLTVHGDYTQTSEGRLRLELDGAEQSDQLAIGGRAHLNGTLEIVAGSRLKPGSQLAVITAAGGIDGRFSRVIQSSLLGGEIVYARNEVIFKYLTSAFGRLESLSDLHLSHNQREIAAALDRASDAQPGLVQSLQAYPFAALPKAFDQIAPEEFGALFEIGLNSANIQAANLDRHLSEVRAGAAGFSASGLNLQDADGTHSNAPDGKEASGPGECWTVFLNGTGEWLDINGDGNARGFNLETGGFTLGADYRVTSNFALGVLAGYVGTSVDLADAGRVRVDGGKLGLYATIFGPKAYLNGLISGGANSYDLRRGGLGGHAHGDTEGGEFHALLSGGYDCHADPWEFGPTAAIQYGYESIDGFQERGSLAPLALFENKTSSLRSQLGGRLGVNIRRFGIRPEIRALWQHEYLEASRSIEAGFPTGGGFQVEGPRTGRDSILLGGSVNFIWSPTLGTFAAYDAELGRRNYRSQTISAGLRWSF
ncbi:MAG: Outer rane autotransporter barrel domain protein [Chthoniobacteraceae bacterium]|nr:Outer rane autotransporter barrel domain protein [Chthoniobacteraceae bacterium]